jgi:TUP1-like enhancer of split
LIITRSGLCSVYDVLAKRLICARSAAPLLARPVDAAGHLADDEVGAVRTDIYRSVAVARVTPTGEPVLSLSDGDVYFYSRDFASWMQVAGSSMSNSEFARGISSPSGVGIVRSLQGSAVTSRHAPSLSGMSDLRRAAVESLSHLETLMECALALSSAIDYRYYLATYASRLASASDDDVESTEKRIRELCDSLLRIDIANQVSRILGMDSRALLSDVVLPVVSSNMALQRIVSEYAESVEELQQKREVVVADAPHKDGRLAKGHK